MERKLELRGDVDDSPRYDVHVEKKPKVFSIPEPVHENVYFTETIDANYADRLDAIVDALFKRDLAEDGLPQAGFNGDLTIGALQEICSEHVDAKVKDVINIVELFRNREIRPLVGHGRDISYNLSDFICTMRNDGDNTHVYNFHDWTRISCSWETGTVTINVDGNIATVNGCGLYASFLISVLAGCGNFGLFGCNVFAFGVQQGEHLDPKHRAIFHSKVDTTEIDWTDIPK